MCPAESMLIFRAPATQMNWRAHAFFLTVTLLGGWLILPFSLPQIW